MKLSTLLAGGISLIALTDAAQAADLLIQEAPAVMAAPMVSASDWSGFYAGAFLGYGWGTIDVGAPVSIEEDAQGLFGGVQLGYNIQTGSLVLGLQTDIALSGIATDEDPADTIDWIGSTTARVGLAMDGVLPYVKAGLAYAGGTGNNNGVEDSQTGFGWTAGAGVELSLADNMSVFGEYDYYDFGTSTFNFGGGSAGDVDVDTTAHAVKVGLNFKF